MNKQTNNLLFDDSNIYAIANIFGYGIILSCGFILLNYLNNLNKEPVKDINKPQSNKDINYSEHQNNTDYIEFANLPVTEIDGKYYVDIPEGYELQEVNGEMMAVKIKEEDTLKLKLTK